MYEWQYDEGVPLIEVEIINPYTWKLPVPDFRLSGIMPLSRLMHSWKLPFSDFRLSAIMPLSRLMHSWKLPFSDF
ncbi:MAG: hypothetical protein ACE5J9_02935, partial [Methanosarcinales archaeon]